MLMSLGDYIRKRRKSKGMTLEDMANKVKRSPATISQWENEDERIPIDMLRDIARALEEPSPVRLYQLAGVLSGMPFMNIIQLMDGMSDEEVEHFEQMVEALAKAYFKQRNH